MSFVRGIEGRPVAVGLRFAVLVQHHGHVVGDMAQVAAFDVHRQVDRRLDVECVTSEGTVVRVSVATRPQRHRRLLVRAR